MFLRELIHYLATIRENNSNAYVPVLCRKVDNPHKGEGVLYPTICFISINSEGDIEIGPTVKGLEIPSKGQFGVII